MFVFFHHLFLPRHSNNHRPKVLHHASLVLAIIALVLLTSFTSFVKSNNPEVLGISYSITTDEMLAQVNARRAQEGLAPLKINEQLSQAAAGKAQHMFGNNYWAHYAPDGTTPWVFIRGAGYDYIDAGENLAKGFTNSSDVVDAWMNSPTHRENIMASKYDDIGFAIATGNLEGEETVLVVQMFGSTGRQVAQEPEETTVAVNPQVFAPENEVAAISPTVFPTQAPSEESVALVQEPLVMGNDSVINKPAISSTVFSKSVIISFMVILLIVFVLDLVIIERKKVPRIVGHNLDHIMLIALFILFILLFKTGFVM